MEIYQKLGKCGVYCGQCRAFTGEVVELSTKFKDWVVKDYSWLKDIESSFDFNNFIKGLDWFTKAKCPGCRESEESWCEVKKCEKIQNEEIDNCLLCNDFSKCPHTDYQRNRYSYLFKHVNIIKEKGFEKYLEEEEKKANEGIRIQDIRDY